MQSRSMDGTDYRIDGVLTRGNVKVPKNYCLLLFVDCLSLFLGLEQMNLFWLAGSSKHARQSKQCCFCFYYQYLYSVLKQAIKFYNGEEEASSSSSSFNLAPARLMNTLFPPGEEVPRRRSTLILGVL